MAPIEARSTDWLMGRDSSPKVQELRVARGVLLFALDTQATRFHQRTDSPGLLEDNSGPQTVLFEPHPELAARLEQERAAEAKGQRAEDA